MKLKDYYKILNVKKDATPAEIKSAYREKVKRLHIDSHAQENLNASEINKLNDLLIELREAYEVLSDNDKRKEFDLLCVLYPFFKESENKVKDEEKQKKSIKDIYNEVKKEEKEYSFFKRHRIVNNKIKTAFPRKENESLPKNIIFSLEKGTIHLFHEIFYQTDEFIQSFKEPLPKFIIKNRYRNLLLVAGIALATNFINEENTFNNSAINYNTEDSYETTTEENNRENNRALTKSMDANNIILNRIYTIKPGDTLYTLATKNGIDQQLVKELNNLKDENINIDKVIILPYKTNINNLEYYTEEISIKNKSLYEIAIEYETDLDTLYNLNKNSIQEINSVFYITSDTIYVPKFITLNQLSEIKSKELIKRIK